MQDDREVWPLCFCKGRSWYVRQFLKDCFIQHKGAQSERGLPRGAGIAAHFKELPLVCTNSDAAYNNAALFGRVTEETRAIHLKIHSPFVCL